MPKKGYEQTREHRRKLGLAYKGRKNAMLGKCHTEEAKQKIGEASKGRIHSKQTRIKMSEERKENNNPRWNGGKRSYWRRQGYKVWEEYWHECVPTGYLLHHMDRNTKNIEIANLSLLTHGGHLKIHGKERLGEQENKNGKET